jgi:hypothetical protein
MSACHFAEQVTAETVAAVAAVSVDQLLAAGLDSAPAAA